MPHNPERVVPARLSLQTRSLGKGLDGIVLPLSSGVNGKKRRCIFKLLYILSINCVYNFVRVR